MSGKKKSRETINKFGVMVNMTEGSIRKGILSFSLPLILSNILQVLFNLSDVAVVGRFAGGEALGSVGSTTQMAFLFTGFLIGMGGGVNALVARYFGAKDDKDVEQTIHTSAILCFILGIVMMIIGLIVTRPFLTLLNTKPELIDGAERYLKIFFFCMPAVALFNFGNGVLSAVGDTKRPLIYLTIAGVINVLLNLMFVIVCDMSVAGVAVASVISQYISAILIIITLLKSTENFKLSPGKLRISKQKAVQVIALGVPAGLQNALFQIANLFIQAAVNSFDAVTVEGNSAAMNADAIVYDVMAAFYTATASFIAQNFGAGKKDRIKKSYIIGIAYSFIIGAILGVLLVVFGRQFLSLFAEDELIIDAGMKRLGIMGLSYGFSAFMDCTTAASRGLGKTAVPTFAVIMGAVVFRIIWVNTVFAHYHTMESLYLLYIFSWTITSIAEVAYFVRIYKRCLIKN